MFQIRLQEFETGEDVECAKFIKLFVFVMTFTKALHFMSTFEELGFFIDMLSSSIRKLGVFLNGYIFFGLIFSVMIIIIGAEPGEAFETSVGLGLFGKTYLFVWGNGACTFGLMNYPTLWAQDPSIFKDINIILIWLLYVVQVQFQTMFGLNFVVAVVEENYAEMLPLRKEHIYRNKAILN